MKKLILTILITVFLAISLNAESMTREEIKGNLESTIMQFYMTGLVKSHIGGKVYVDSYKWVFVRHDVKEAIAYVFAADHAMSACSEYITEIVIYNHETGKEIDFYELETE